MEYLRNPMFWLAVVVVSAAVHFVISRFMPSMGGGTQ